MITLADVQAALERIRPSIYLSPCTLSATFSQLTGNSIYLKLDNLQRTGAFKERGALNKLLTMSGRSVIGESLQPRPEITRRDWLITPVAVELKLRSACRLRLL